MRIGLYNPYFDDLGGGEKYMMSIAQCLSYKNQVTVFWNNLDDVKKLIERFSLDLSKVNFSKNIFQNTSFLERAWETRKYDAIIVLSDGSIPWVFSKKLFIHFQQPFTTLLLDSKTKTKMKRVNSFFCNSLFTKSYIDKLFKIESLVIYPPVDIKVKKVKKENILLTVGRFRVKDVTTKSGAIGDYKKHGELLNAFKQMVDKGLSGWRFVIATSVKDSERALFEQFKKRAKGYPIDFLVNKKNDELWNIYSKAKIYWHASGFGEDLQKYPEFAEHFGISTVEAMGAGAAPVVINAGGQKEIVEEGKSGFLWNSVKELEAKTLNLINDKELLARISKNAQKSAQKFSQQEFCNKVNEMILA